MRSMSVSQFKATCLARFEEIAKGGEPIVITKRGVPIAQVQPLSQAGRRRELGRLAGSIVVRRDLVAERVGDDGEQSMLDEWAELHG